MDPPFVVKGTINENAWMTARKKPSWLQPVSVARSAKALAEREQSPGGGRRLAKAFALHRSENRSKGQVSVECATGSQEACTFAEEITSALKDGGWAVSFTIAALTGVKPGFLLMQRNEGDALPHVRALHDVFKGAGILLEVGFNPRIQEGQATLLVGPKP